jgi:hypothetical protein
MNKLMYIKIKKINLHINGLNKMNKYFNRI